MTRRATVGVIFVAVIAAVLGAVGGYIVAQQRAKDLDSQRRDLITAVRAVEFENRLGMLRLLREHKVPDEDMRSMEISAIVLLGTIALDDSNSTSQSHVVLQRAADAVATYRRDFPKSELSDGRHRKVAQLLAVGSRK
jgi:hypothetical protein